MDMTRVKFNTGCTKYNLVMFVMSVVGSAGIGRTATVLIVDMILQQIRQQGEIISHQVLQLPIFGIPMMTQ